MRKILAPSGWALGMLVLILDGKTALTGAAEGIALCMQTLIPSLFPFFVLSMMLTSTLGGGSLLLAGILGGYPVGAGNAAQAYRAGLLSQAEAERMVVLCNCAGISFLFGVVSPILGSLRDTLMLWAAYLTSVLALWMIFPKTKTTRGPSKPLRLQEALWRAIRAMAGVCGWVVLFRVLLAILERWVLWLLPERGQAVAYGILELSNGCLFLRKIPEGLRCVLAAGFLGFGGICVMMQTASVAEGISLRLYLPGKLFQGAVSMLAASFLFPGSLSPTVQAILAVSAGGLGYILEKIEKRSGNPAAIGV